MIDPVVYPVVPAAGLSRRMGRPKLNLPLGGKAVLSHVLDRLARTTARPALVALGPSTAFLAPLVRPPTRYLILPADTPDMRTTLERGLEWIEVHESPRPTDAFLLALADQPMLSPPIMDRLIHAHQADPTRIRVPAHQGRRGHPVLFPWTMVEQLRGLPQHVGANSLLKDHLSLVTELPTDEPEILDDIDEPADYDRAASLDWNPPKGE